MAERRRIGYRTIGYDMDESLPSDVSRR
jgi:hypothetical protein